MAQALAPLQRQVGDGNAAHDGVAGLLERTIGRREVHSRGSWSIFDFLSQPALSRVFVKSGDHRTRLT